MRTPHPTVRPSSNRTVISVTTIALAIATALVLMQLASLVASLNPSIAVPAINRAEIDRFYNAINTTIATGDAATLNDLLAPNFSILNRDRPVETGPTGLIDHTLSLHRSYPTLRLVVRDHVADARTAIVSVEIDGVSENVSLATPLGSHVGEVTDRLTIFDGKVAELHGIVWDLTPAVLLVQAAIQRPAPDAMVGLARMTLDGPTAPFALSALGPIVIAVESGSVKVQGGTTGAWSRNANGAMSTPSTIDVGVAQELLPGDQFVSPKGTPFVLLNARQTPATVLVIAVIPRVEWIRGTSSNNVEMQRSIIIVMMTAINDTQSQTNNALPLGVRAARIAIQLSRLDDGENHLRLESLDLPPSTQTVMHSRTATRLIVLDHDATGLVILNRAENGQNIVASIFAPDTLVFVPPLAQITARNLDERRAALLILSWQ